MKYKYEIKGKTKNKVDNTIYSFDIETTSYIIYNDKIYPAIEYKNLTKKEQEKCIFGATMYIWTFGINDIIYYGRTYEELRTFLNMIENYNPNKKVLFIHNLSYEFHFLSGVFDFENVMSRRSHKVMRAFLKNWNWELRCSLYLSNAKLENLPKTYGLPIEKLVGELDYTKLRNYKTKISDKELKYCENDCLIIYYYIQKELLTYKRVDKIPLTSTGKVRKELKEQIDYNYKQKVRKAINVNPHIYNMLHDAFMGRIYTCKLYLHRRYYKKCNLI